MNFKKFRKFKKNAKALSPVIATIILIAVTVAVSVVVAAWMGALTIGFMGNAEQAKITNTAYVSNNCVQVTVQNTGSSTVTLASANIDANPATISAATAGQTAPWNIAKGTSVSFDITFTAAGLQFNNTAQYAINLQTAKGNTLTTTYTYAGAPTA
jgi:flagellin-like protein